MVNFHEGLSERSVYLRYFSPLKLQQRVAHTRLVRICFNDYDREIALVAEHKDGDGKSEIVGVARLSKLHTNNAGEFAVVVTDQWQRKGLGTELTKRLIQIAKNEKLAAWWPTPCARTKTCSTCARRSASRSAPPSANPSASSR